MCGTFLLGNERIRIFFIRATFANLLIGASHLTNHNSEKTGNSPALHWQQKILISTKGRRIQTFILSKWLFLSYKCNVIRWIYPTYPSILGYLDCYRCHQESFTHFTHHAYVFNSNIDSVYFSAF